MHRAGEVRTRVPFARQLGRVPQFGHADSLNAPGVEDLLRGIKQLLAHGLLVDCSHGALVDGENDHSLDCSKQREWLFSVGRAGAPRPSRRQGSIRHKNGRFSRFRPEASHAG